MTIYYESNNVMKIYDKKGEDYIKVMDGCITYFRWINLFTQHNIEYIYYTILVQENLYNTKRYPSSNIYNNSYIFYFKS